MAFRNTHCRTRTQAPLVNRRASALALAMVAGLVLSATESRAEYIVDGTFAEKYRFTSPRTNPGTWADRVGGTDFEVFGVDVNSSIAAGGTMSLDLYTNYGLKNEAPFGTRTADISFQLLDQDDFNHGIILYDHGTDAREDDNNLTVGFYEVDSWLTSVDVLGDSGYVYSGRRADCNSNATCNLETPELINTYLDEGTLLIDPFGNGTQAGLMTMALTVDTNVLTPDNKSAEFRINVTMTGVAGLFGPDWEMVWGNATCGNDTIHVSGVGIPSVPEPAAALLLLVGVGGLLGGRRMLQRT